MATDAIAFPSASTAPIFTSISQYLITDSTAFTYIDGLPVSQANLGNNLSVVGLTPTTIKTTAMHLTYTGKSTALPSPSSSIASQAKVDSTNFAYTDRIKVSRISSLVTSQDTVTAATDSIVYLSQSSFASGIQTTPLVSDGFTSQEFSDASSFAVSQSGLLKASASNTISDIDRLPSSRTPTSFAAQGLVTENTELMEVLSPSSFASGIQTTSLDINDFSSLQVSKVSSYDNYPTGLVASLRSTSSYIDKAALLPTSTSVSSTASHFTNMYTESDTQTNSLTFLQYRSFEMNEASFFADTSTGSLSTSEISTVADDMVAMPSSTAALSFSASINSPESQSNTVETKGYVPTAPSERFISRTPSMSEAPLLNIGDRNVTAAFVYTDSLPALYKTSSKSSFDATMKATASPFTFGTKTDTETATGLSLFSYNDLLATLPVFSATISFAAPTSSSNIDRSSSVLVTIALPSSKIVNAISPTSLSSYIQATSIVYPTLYPYNINETPTFATTTTAFQKKASENSSSRKLADISATYLSDTPTATTAAAESIQTSPANIQIAAKELVNSIVRLISVLYQQLQSLQRIFRI